MYSTQTVKQLRKIMTARKIVGRSKITRKANIIIALINWDNLQFLNAEVKKAITSGELAPPKYISWKGTEFKVKHSSVENWYAASATGEEVVLPRTTASIVDYRGMCAHIIKKSSKFYNALTAFQAVDRMAHQMHDYKTVYQHLLQQGLT